MIKAIIFDCFGVVRLDPLLAAYQTVGGDIVKDQRLIQDTINDANSGKIPSSSAVFTKRLEVSESEWREALEAEGAVNQPVLDYVLELRQNYKTAMLSNVSAGGLQRWFEPGVLEKYFDVAIASGDIGFAKPDAQAYETVAERLGVRFDECIMIDDRQDYCDGARAAGMQAILYQNLDQLKSEITKILSVRGQTSNR